MKDVVLDEGIPTNLISYFFELLFIFDGLSKFTNGQVSNMIFFLFGSFFTGTCIAWPGSRSRTNGWWRTGPVQDYQDSVPRSSCDVQYASTRGEHADSSGGTLLSSADVGS
jgi:hypothetical protein